MNTMNLDDSASDRVDPISPHPVFQRQLAMGEKSSPRAINPRPTLTGLHWSRQYHTLPYEVMPESDETMNTRGYSSFGTPSSAVDHVNRNNQSSPVSHIPSLAANLHSLQQSDHGIAPEPAADYTNSCSDGYPAQQYSTSNSIAGSHTGNTYFKGSGLGTTPLKNYRSSGNGFGTSVPTHQSFPFPAIADAPQNPQNLRLPFLARRRSSSSLLEVPVSTRCSRCGAVSKTQSEHKKHMARHEKPHRCPIPSCDARFATASDLERHTRSKHLTGSQEGQLSKLHSCPVEPCKSRGRRFPRLDNFRNHLKNKHNLNEDVVERLVDSSKRSVHGSASHRRRGQTVGSYTASPQSPMAWDFPTNTGTDLIQNTGGFMNDYSPVTIQDPPQQIVELDVPAFGAQSPSYPSSQSPAPTAWISYGDRMDGMVSPRQEVSQPQIPPSPENFSHSADIPMRSQYSSEAGSLYERKDHENARQAAFVMGFDVVPRPYPEEATGDSSRRSQKQRSKHADGFDTTCKTCLRFGSENRRSDLKKHLTRYLHMFFCTDSLCSATFGSKDELRRHENCTHENFEKWRCTLAIKEREGVICGYESFHAHAFKDHLKTVHSGLSGANGHTLDAEGFRIVDENFPVQFWCGFCKHRFEMIGDAPQRVRGRLNHFEDHLKGRNKWELGTVHTWVHEPVEGSQVAKILDCQQHRKTTLPIHYKSKNPPAPINSPQGASASPVVIPRIVIPNHQLDITQQHSLGQPPQASGFEGGSSSGYPRPRKRTTKTCCQCLDFLVGRHHVCCSSCGHQIEGCATCITVRMSFEELENATHVQS